MRKLLFILLLLPLTMTSQVTKFMGRYDVTEVDSVSANTWRLYGTFTDLTGSYRASDASVGDKIIQRGYDSLGRIVYDRYVITGIPIENETVLEVSVQSDFSGGVQNYTGRPLTGSFPIASPATDSTNLTYKTSLYINQIDLDYEDAIDNLNLESTILSNFPGFGTSHSMAAYGDHSHTQYISSEADSLKKFDAKGDILTATADNAYKRLPIGANGTILRVRGDTLYYGTDSTGSAYPDTVNTVATHTWVNSKNYITDGNTNWDNTYGFITGNQSISLSGDASGSGTTAITVAVADDSHNHIQSNIDNLSDTLTRIHDTIDNYIHKSYYGAAGDLLVGTGDNTLTRLSIGTNRKFLRSNGTTAAWDTVQSASASATGLLKSTDWSTFNGKQPQLNGTGFVKASGTTISYDNSTYSTTSHNHSGTYEPVLTKGNLTEATSSVLTISGGTGAVIGSGASIQVKQSSSTQAGYLSSTDWNTFNNKVSMVYPEVGIALSNGAGWNTSITNNSANWNTAYGWGNHASAGYMVSPMNTAGDMIYRGASSPQRLAIGKAREFLRVPSVGVNPAWDTIAMAASNSTGLLKSTDFKTFSNARAVSNHDSLGALDEKSYNSLTDKPSLGAMASGGYPGFGIALSSGSGWSTSISDNSSAWNNARAISNHDSLGSLDEKSYNSLTDKPSLGAMASGGYPGSGIPISTGSGWSTSITDKSSDWNTAYGWGNHASAGYITDGNTNWDNSYGFITGNQSISLSGDASGSGTTAITVVVADDSHNHVIGNTDNLQDSLTNRFRRSDTSSVLLSRTRADRDYLTVPTVRNVSGGGVYVTSASSDTIVTPSYTPTVWGGTFEMNTKVGVAGEEVSLPASADAWGKTWGNDWNAYLDRIDYTFDYLHKNGIKWYKSWSPYPVKYWGNMFKADSSRINLDNPVLDWSALDRSMELCRKYGIKMVIVIPPHDNTYSPYKEYYTTKETTLNNWYVPWAVFLANRYKGYSDMLYIDAFSEMNWRFLPSAGKFSNIVPGVNDSLDADWVTMQSTVYDSVKAIAPDVKVLFPNTICYTGFKNQFTAVGMLQQMYDRGKISKFDDAVTINLYPIDTSVYYPNYYASQWITPPSGNITYIDSVVKKLGEVGRPDVKVSIGESGVFWLGSGQTTVTNGSDVVTVQKRDRDPYPQLDFRIGDSVHFIGDTRNYKVISIVPNTSITLNETYKGTSRDSCGYYNVTEETRAGEAFKMLVDSTANDDNVMATLLWGIWGSDRQIDYAIISNALGAQGMGLMTEDTRRITKVGETIQDMMKGSGVNNISSIKFKSGLYANKPTWGNVGEPLFATDYKHLYIGRGPEYDPVLINPFVVNDYSDALFFSPSGRIGFNTGYYLTATRPEAMLHMVGGGALNQIMLDNNGIPARITGRSHQGIPNFIFATTSGDTLFKIEAAGHDGTDFRKSATIRFMASQGYSSTATGSDIVFSTVDDDSTTLKDRMYIDDNGSVGIGVSPPGSKFHVRGLESSYSSDFLFDGTGASNQPRLIFRRALGTYSSPSAVQTGNSLFNIQARAYGSTGYSSASRASISVAAGENWTDSNQGTYMTFSTTANTTTTTSERVRIKDNGYVGIGTQSPQTKLNVKDGALRMGVGSYAELDSTLLFVPKVMYGATDTTGVGSTANEGTIMYYKGHFYGLIGGSPPQWKQLD